MVSTAGVRRFIVPADIVAVPRRSPIPVRKKTPWHPQRDASVATNRPGGREWFSSLLFVETQPGIERSAYGTSISCHCAAVLALVVAVVMQPVQVVRIGGSASLVMPVTLLPEPAAPSTAGPPRNEPKTPQRSPDPERAAAPRAGVVVPVPLEAPSGVEPETGAESGGGAADGGGQDGAGGVEGGGGTSFGNGSGRIGPFRVGGDITPPRKIKDVKPLYPAGLLNDDTRGSVVIEATVDANGDVRDAKVVHSVVSALDREALDAVRQWKYAPSLLDGRPVSVVITVIVNFAIQ